MLIKNPIENVELEISFAIMARDSRRHRFREPNCRHRCYEAKLTDKKK
jgi:hypothetical protein